MKRFALALAWVLVVVAAALAPSYLQFTVDPAYWTGLWTAVGSLGGLYITTTQAAAERGEAAARAVQERADNANRALDKERRDRELALQEAQERRIREAREGLHRALMTAYGELFTLDVAMAKLLTRFADSGAIENYRGRVLQVVTLSSGKVHEGALALAKFLAAATEDLDSFGNSNRLNKPQLHKLQHELAAAMVEYVQSHHAPDPGGSASSGISPER